MLTRLLLSFAALPLFLGFGLVSCKGADPVAEHGEETHAEDHAHPHPHPEETGEDHPHPHPGEEEEHAHPHGEDAHADHGDEHAHEEGEEKTAVVTVWDDRYEIFMEHPYIVAGALVTFVTHVTDLKTLCPRKEGPAEFVFRHESGTPLEHTDRAPARAGIYLPEITLPSAGTWAMSLLIPAEGVTHSVELPPLTVYPSEEAVASAQGPESPEGISFLKEQQWRILSQTEPVRREALSESLRLAGRVSARPGSRAVVTPPTEGRLVAPPGQTLPFLGDKLEAGQVLAVIQPAPAAPAQEMALDIQVRQAEIEAQAASAEATLEAAQQALRRTRDLFEKKAKSAREVEEAELAVRRAEAEREAARSLGATVRSAGTRLSANARTGAPAVEVRAPIAGVVAEARATEGEYVRPETHLFTVLDAGTVLVEARVPETKLGLLGESPQAPYELPGATGSPVPLLGEGGGRFVHLGGEVDPATRTVPGNAIPVGAVSEKRRAVGRDGGGGVDGAVPRPPRRARFARPRHEHPRGRGNGLP